jgi:fucose permease
VTATSNNRFITSLVICLGLFLFAYTVPLANPAKEQIGRSLGIEKSEDTWPLFTSYFAAWFFIVPPSAFLADRFGRKTMLLVGSLTLAVGMILFSMATDLTTGCIAQFLNGAGAIILQIVGAAVITDLYSDSRGSTLSLVVGIVGMVALLSPILMAELLTRGVAWQTVYQWSAVLPLIAFAVQLGCHIPRAASASVVTLADVGTLLTSPLFLMLIGAMLVYGIVEQGIPIWAPSYLGEDLGVDQRSLGFVVAGYFLIMSLVRTAVGGLKLFTGVPYTRMIAVSAALGAACVAVATTSGNGMLGCVFIVLSGAAIAQIWPSIMTYAVESSGKPTTTVFGLIVGIGGALGVIFGSSVLGMIKQRGFTYQHSLLTLEVPLLLLVVVFAYIGLARRRNTIVPVEK